MTTGSTLGRPVAGNLVNGNDPAYRVSSDGGPLDVDVPPGAALRVCGMWDFQRGKYETNSASSWSDGDWNCDGLFGSADLVAAFQRGWYEAAALNAVASVVEVLGAFGISPKH